MKLKNLTNYLIAAAVLIAALCGFLALAQSGVSTKKSVFALNTYTSVTAYGAGGSTAADAAAEKIHAVEEQFSAYLDTSEVAYVNSIGQKNVPIPVSDALFSVLKAALAYSEQTGGRFDITVKPITDLWAFSSANPRVPAESELAAALTRTGYQNVVLDEANKTVTFLKDGMQLDLGGIAKGYAADEVAKTLADSGCNKALVDLGGNIMLLGQNNTPWDNFCNNWLSQDINRAWRVGIQTPFAPTGSYLAVVSVQNTPGGRTSVVTSGAYERNFTQDGVLYHHIIDPATGYPYHGVVDSVTVIGVRSMVADALSTSIFMMDIEAGLALARENGYDVLIVDKNKKLHTTLDKNRVELTDSAYSFAE